jgi:hypothetical protein
LIKSTGAGSSIAAPIALFQPARLMNRGIRYLSHLIRTGRGRSTII